MKSTRQLLPRGEENQGLAGISARNSGLKINKHEVLSSELIETERTSAGSLLTTSQQRLLPPQLFCPRSLLQVVAAAALTSEAAHYITAQKQLTKETWSGQTP